MTVYADFIDRVEKVEMRRIRVVSIGQNPSIGDLVWKKISRPEDSLFTR